MSTPGDEPRDAHLLAALRNAPDHDAAPPAALSARILAQAQQAVARPVRPSAPGLVERWLSWWSRPVMAGAFGSLLIAGVVGMMWREGPPPEAMPGADAPMPAAAPAPSQASAAAPMSAPAPAAAPAPTVVTGVAVPRPLPRAPAADAAPPAAAPAQAARSPAAPPAETPIAPAAQENTARPAAPAPAPPAAPAPAAKSRAAESTAEATPAATPAPAPEPAPAPAPPPMPAAPPPPPAAASPTLPSPRDLAAAGARPSAARLAAAPADPLAAPLAALSDAADATWRNRLITLRRQAQGRWLRTEALPAGAGEVVPDANGRALGRLLVQSGRAVWQGADSLAWQAMLPAAADPSAPAASR